MHKLWIWVWLGLALAGLVFTLGALKLDIDYKNLRKDMSIGRVERGLSYGTRFLSSDEKLWLEEHQTAMLLEKGEKIFFDAISLQHLRDPYRLRVDYASVKKDIRELREKISGTSWRAYASRGQLAVRELVMGMLGKSDDKELKQLWSQAVSSYKEARMHCTDVNTVDDYKECVDTVTKSYEFLIRPGSRGGLGGQEGASGAEQSEGPGDLPLIRGRGAGAGPGAFGSR